jgi:hypothetical protein
MFSTPKQHTEPMPTRDTAADAVDEAEKKRRATLQGMRSTMLTSPGGVTTELTGTRRLTNG